MRTFNFKARNIGTEKYLTYTMGEECELDEDVLDYCEENSPKELLGIIYEEDDDYDYLTYDITGRTTVGELIKKEISCEKVLLLLRNIAKDMISLKEQAIHLSYILLNKDFVYVEDDMEVRFICLPIESEGSLATEFKGFVRQLLANMKYDVDEELGYVGKLLTYINGDSFNLRGLVGLSEALMEESGISFEEAADIDADGVEVVNSEDVADSVSESENNVSNFMNELSESDDALPEIGDDEEEEEEETDVQDDEELESILPAGMKPVSEEAEEEAANDETVENEVVENKTTEEPEKVQDEAVETAPSEVEEKEEVKEEQQEAKEEMFGRAPLQQKRAKVEPKLAPASERVLPTQPEADIDVIKNRIKELVGEVPSAKTKTEPIKSIKTLDDLDQLLDNKPPVIKKNVVKVNRAALIQNAAEHEGETEELTSEMTAEGAVPVIEETQGESEKKPKSNSILSKTVAEPKKNTLFSAPKAMPYLIRVNTEERIMLSKVTFKIGKATRGVDYTVSGNGAVSRQHAMIVQKDGVCYIKDNKSTNHTYVNGKAIEDGMEEILTHDSMIKLGDEEFIFKIR